MNISTNNIHIDTTKAPEFIDITDKIKEFVAESGVNNGIAVIYSTHTT